MIGLISRTISPSSVTSSRSTPCVAGWWGPMLSVSSSTDSPVRWSAIWWAIGAIAIDSSFARYSAPALTASTPGWWRRCG